MGSNCAQHVGVAIQGSEQPTFSSPTRSTQDLSLTWHMLAHAFLSTVVVAIGEAIYFELHPEIVHTRTCLYIQPAQKHRLQIAGVSADSRVNLVLRVCVAAIFVARTATVLGGCQIEAAACWTAMCMWPLQLVQSAFAGLWTLKCLISILQADIGWLCLRWQKALGLLGSIFDDIIHATHLPEATNAGQHRLHYSAFHHKRFVLRILLQRQHRKRLCSQRRRKCNEDWTMRVAKSLWTVCLHSATTVGQMLARLQKIIHS